MAKFKDIMHAFFYEDVDDDETEAAETPAQESKPEQTEPAAPVTTIEPAPASVAPTPVAPIPPVTPAPASVVETQTSGSFVMLDANDISAPEQQQASTKTSGKKKPYRYNREKANRPGTRLSGMGDYKAVLSPIFGNIEDEKKEYDQVHDAINLPAPDASFEMTQVISPMFGSASAAETPITKTPKPSEETKPAQAAEQPKEEKPQPVKPAKASANLADFLTKEPVGTGHKN